MRSGRIWVTDGGGDGGRVVEGEDTGWVQAFRGDAGGAVCGVPQVLRGEALRRVAAHSEIGEEV